MHRFNNLPMTVKMLLLVLPVLIIIFITDEISYNRIEKSIYSETIGSSTESLESVSVYIDGEFKNLSSLFAVLEKDPAINNYISFYSNDQYVSGRGIDIGNELIDRLRTYFPSLHHAESIGVILSSFRVKQYSGTGRDEELNNLLYQLSKSGYSSSTASVVSLSAYGNDGMLFAYPARIGSARYTLFALLDSDYFHALFENCARSSVEYFILNGRQIVYQTNPESAFQDTAVETGSSCREADFIHAAAQISDVDGYTYITDTIPSMGWRVVSVQPNPYPYNSLITGRRISVYTRILVIILTLAMFLVISISFTRRLNEINHTMEKIENGNLDFRFSPVYSDEISQLGRHLNNMVTQIRLQANEITLRHTQVKEAQLKALQNQINPHFLYNSLEHIRMQAVANGDAQIADQVKILGEMLRYNIQNDFETVTIKQEYDQVNRYLAMQKYLLHERLNLVYDVDESVMSRSVIKFLLQPIVENSILHGVSPKVSPSDLLIRIKDDGDRIDFEISDTGCGIEEEKLREIKACLDSIEQTEQPSARIGLKNVSDRLVLFYGRASVLHIESSLGEGTTVHFSIPSAGREASC